MTLLGSNPGTVSTGQIALDTLRSTSPLPRGQSSRASSRAVADSPPHSDSSASSWAPELKWRRPRLSEAVKAKLRKGRRSGQRQNWRKPPPARRRTEGAPSIDVENQDYELGAESHGDNWFVRCVDVGGKVQEGTSLDNVMTDTVEPLDELSPETSEPLPGISIHGSGLDLETEIPVPIPASLSEDLPPSAHPSPEQLTKLSPYPSSQSSGRRGSSDVRGSLEGLSSPKSPSANLHLSPPKPLSPAPTPRLKTPVSSSPVREGSMGPLARYPYTARTEDGVELFSCRPGGPRIYDLLNPLPLAPYGALSWFILEREEELFELHDIADEDKVMQALWGRWILVNR